jgi:hypothetical protein
MILFDYYLFFNIEKGKELFGTAKDKIKNWYEGWK